MTRPVKNIDVVVFASIAALMGLVNVPSKHEIKSCCPIRPDPIQQSSPIRQMEDWSKISLETSHLQAKEPLPGEKADLPQFTRELIQVQWRLNDAIDLYVIRPKNVKRPPVILYLYPYYDTVPRFRDNRFCERVTGDWFAAVGFVSALSGYRFRMRPMRENFISELPEALATSTHDV